MTKKNTYKRVTNQNRRKTSRNEKGGSTLFDPTDNQVVSVKQLVSEKVDLPRLFVSVDNNIAHHYWAQMSIFCRDAAESPHFKHAFSVQLDNVVLLSKEPLFLESSASDEIQYPVALELDCGLLGGLKCRKIVKHDISREEDFLYDAVAEPFDLIAVSGLIPFSSVRKIHFLSEENESRFFSFPASNIIFDRSRAKVSPDRFKRAVKLSTKLTQKVRGIPSCGKKIKKLNHIRAALLASINSFHLPITENVTTSYDKMVLEVLFSGTSDSFEKQYNNLKNEISQRLAEMGHFPILDCKEGVLDRTFSEFKWVLEMTTKKADMDLPPIVEDLDPSNTVETLFDRYAYRVLAWLLLNEVNYIQIQFVEKYKDALNQHLGLFRKLEQIDYNKLQEQMDKYGTALDRLIQIIKGLSFQKHQGDRMVFSTLKAFFDFTLGFSGEDHFCSLEKRLSLLGPGNDYHKRLTWSLYGLLYGMCYINNPLRQDCNLSLWLIDNRIGCPLKWDKNIQSDSGYIVKSGDLAAIIMIRQSDQELDKLIRYLKEKDKSFIDEKMKTLRSELAKRIWEIQSK